MSKFKHATKNKFVNISNITEIEVSLQNNPLTKNDEYFVLISYVGSELISKITSFSNESFAQAFCLELLSNTNFL
jgi:hypothetical protein